MQDARLRAADYLRLLQRSGYLVLPAAQVTPVCPITEGVVEHATPAAVVEPVAVKQKQASSAVENQVEEKRAALAEVSGRIAACTRCALHATRTNVVPGEGNPDARIAFVGEAPGQDEDQTGRPFVGRAGELLTRMIAAMHFRREEVFILNVIKCRPPGNRNPEPEEINACEHYLLRQLEIIQPRMIVTLGKFASQRLLNTGTPISRLRGQWAEYNGIPVMPTFHPSYLLRSPSEKRLAWEDLQKVMAEYERLVGPLPERPAED